MTSESKTKGRQPRPSKAEVREAARRRGRRTQLAYGLAALAAVILAVVLIAKPWGGDSGGVGPSTSNEVTVAGGPRSQPLQAGEAVPGFSAPALGGGRFTWSDYVGKPTVLAVWAPWCPHCQVELPVLARVAADYPAVQLVSVAGAIGDHPGPSVNGYMTDNGLTFPVAIDDANYTLLDGLGVSEFPTVYYVGSDGKVVQMTSGETPEEALRQLFGQLS